MRQLGAKLAAYLQPGDLVVLRGNLGAGKTALTQGIGEFLGVSDVTSPTFVIARTHKGNTPLIHVDAYRLLDSGTNNFEIDDLDLDTSRSSAITVIEWGEAVAARLNEDYLLIDISFGSSDEERNVEFIGHGARWQGFSL
jgi:tRNA threonylcarbamoyladenosine biosynthesis protein TsaE